MAEGIPRFRIVAKLIRGGSMRPRNYLALSLLLSSVCWAQHGPNQAMIYDDDCSQDVDCVATLPILYQLADRGEIQVLAMIADSANPLTAPVMSIFAKQGGHPQTPIGANQSNDPTSALCAKNNCNTSKWTADLVERFDAGDTREKYPDCVAVYRKVLSHSPERGVAIVETGFTPCLLRLLASPPDATSPLNGEALVKRSVKLLSVMGGKYPAGTEWNFASDAAGYHALFSHWTRQNGFPPIYLNGFANGQHVMAGAPASASPTANPTLYAMQLTGKAQRPMWDMLSALFAARGLAYEGTTYFTVSKPGTVAVDADTGANTWSDATDSGHYVLTNVAPDETFTALFDGYAHDGFLAKPSAARQGIPPQK
jgi:hypothetical protein